MIGSGALLPVGFLLLLQSFKFQYFFKSSQARTSSSPDSSLYVALTALHSSDPIGRIISTAFKNSILLYCFAPFTRPFCLDFLSDFLAVPEFPEPVDD